jgi:hypothetical protein
MACQIVRDPAAAAVHICATQLLGAHILAGRCADEGRAAEKHRPRSSDDHRFVRHCGDIGAAGGAGAHHRGYLWNTHGRHDGLVIENASKMLPVREDVGLEWKERPPRVDEVEAGKPVLYRDLLRAEVFFHGEGIIGSPLHRRIVGHDHTFGSPDAADSGQESGRGSLTPVHPPCGEGSDLEERRLGVEETLNPFAGRRLALLPLAPLSARSAAFAHLLKALRQHACQPFMVRAVGFELRRSGVNAGF